MSLSTSASFAKVDVPPYRLAEYTEFPLPRRAAGGTRPIEATAPQPRHAPGAEGARPVLSEEQNRALTEVGAGTRMGELLRRYWMPIAGVAELGDTPIKPVRLLGEDL